MENQELLDSVKEAHRDEIVRVQEEKTREEKEKALRELTLDDLEKVAGGVGCWGGDADVLGDSYGDFGDWVNCNIFGQHEGHNVEQKYDNNIFYLKYKCDHCPYTWYKKDILREGVVVDSTKEEYDAH